MDEQRKKKEKKCSQVHTTRRDNECVKRMNNGNEMKRNETKMDEVDEKKKEKKNRIVHTHFTHLLIFVRFTILCTPFNNVPKYNA